MTVCSLNGACTNSRLILASHSLSVLSAAPSQSTFLGQLMAPGTGCPLLQVQGRSVAKAGSAALTPWGPSPLQWGRRIQIQIRHARLNCRPFGWTETETERSVCSYPSNVPNLMESLDSGHTTVKTENSQPGLSKARTLAHESYCGVLGWLQFD